MFSKDELWKGKLYNKITLHNDAWNTRDIIQGYSRQQYNMHVCVQDKGTLPKDEIYKGACNKRVYWTRVNLHCTLYKDTLYKDELFYE